MYTIIETATFEADACGIWLEGERSDFCSWITNNPESGDVVPGSGCCRKVRWGRQGIGKRGGVRVIYYNRLDNGVIWLLVIYAKTVRGNIPGHLLKTIKEAIDDE